MRRPRMLACAGRLVSYKGYEVLLHAIRGLDLKKKPSISETLDWARALVVLNADRLDPTLARDTLNLILKYEGDATTTASRLDEILKKYGLQANKLSPIGINQGQD